MSPFLVVTREPGVQVAARIVHPVEFGVPISDHVTIGECVCRHCARFPVEGMHPDVIARFEILRAALGGHPLGIVSAFRCFPHNQAIGGAPESYHMRGMALDLTSRSAAVERLHRAACGIIGDRGGVGRYPGFVHIDVRGKKVRWSVP